MLHLLLAPVAILLIALAARLGGLTGSSGSHLFGDVGSVESFIPEIWAAMLLTSLKKALVYAQDGIVNRDYEGEITEAGDTVRINSIGRPTVATYTKNSTTITPENLTTAQRTLIIDQSKYFAFEVDDIDARQVAGGALEGGLVEAAYSLAEVADEFVAGLYTSTQAANVIGTTAVTTADAAFQGLIHLRQKLDEANVPKVGRWVVLAPWYEALLLQDNRIVTQYASGSTDALRNGQTGRLLGFDCYVSNNAPLITGDDYAIMAGVPGAISYAEQINKVEAYRPQSSFADALKGLHLYGAKVVRPDAIAYLTASQT